MEEAPLEPVEGETEDYPAAEEMEDQEETVAPPLVTTPAPKKRGRPAGSKGKAPDVYAALLERMTQLEQPMSRPSVAPDPETPPPLTRPRGKPGHDRWLLHR